MNMVIKFKISGLRGVYPLYSHLIKDKKVCTFFDSEDCKFLNRRQSAVIWRFVPGKRSLCLSSQCPQLIISKLATAKEQLLTVVPYYGLAGTL